MSLIEVPFSSSPLVRVDREDEEAQSEERPTPLALHPSRNGEPSRAMVSALRAVGEAGIERALDRGQRGRDARRVESLAEEEQDVDPSTTGKNE
jgi:hypothetical protein